MNQYSKISHPYYY